MGKYLLLQDIVATMRTTRSLFSAFLLYFKDKKRRIVFKNGSSFIVNHDEYYNIRKLILDGYEAEQLNDRFRVFGSKFDLNTDSANLSELSRIAANDVVRAIHQSGRDLFEVECKNFNLTGSWEVLRVLDELALGVYDCDCAGKTVLDVGGFQGESAVIFSAMMGAKKVIIYEPVLSHHSLIRRNIELNNVDAEIHAEGIGERDMTRIVHFDKPDLGFSLDSNGTNSVEITLRNVSDVISLSHAEVAKFDCECSEIHLVTVPADVLIIIEYYIVETHSSAIKSAVIEKFVDCGYKILKDLNIGGPISVIHFIREK
jgi:FkbM family methyltransferase